MIQFDHTVFFFISVGSGYVTLREDASDTTNSIQEDVSQTSTDNISKQISNTDDITAKDESETNDTLSDTEIGFKKIFRFGGVKFTLKKDKVEKIDVDELVENVQDRNATGPSSDSWDNMDMNSVDTNEQHAAEIKNDRMEGDASAESPETHNEMAVGKIPELTEDMKEDTPEGLKEDVPLCPVPEEPMSPIKRFFSQGILATLRRKKKEEERRKQNEEELKGLDEVIEKDTTKEETTCMCLDVSNGAFDKDKDIPLYKKEESKPAGEGDLMNFIEQDKAQASPFKRLFRKLSTRRQSETKPGDPNLLEPGENIPENPQISTELITSQKEEEPKVVETQPADEMMDMSNESSKKKTDSTVSWENLICVRSAKTRTRKTSDSEDETQDKGEVPRRTTESPLESSTEGDHLTSSNEQGKSPAEEDSGSTWKSLKKLVTPKRKSAMEESGSLEQMQSDTEISKDESSCSLRKLISGRKKMKPDGQQENISSDEGSRGTGTDIEDDETPGVVPLSEYEAKPEILNTMNNGTIESKNEKEMQPRIEDDKPKQMQPLYNVKPLCFDARPSGVPVPTEYMEELTEFLSKHQQLSDIPEEGIIEETVASPLSNAEWITQDDTLADDIDMTADAVTAPEHASEYNEDETTEMVSAVSQLSESPKTSGNVTPIPPVYNLRESDKIFQEVVESVNMVPSVLAITTKDEIPEALAVSVSQFIVESSTTTETKVLVSHKKEAATSICIGIVSQEIIGAEFVLPLPLVEGISEMTHAVPTELVSEEMTEESQVAGTSTDNVYEAEIKEIKSMLYEVLMLHEQSTILAETARTSNQELIMVENIQEEVSSVVQMEGVENDSTELLNGIDEFTPVHAVVHGGTQVIEEQIITLNTNRPEAEGPLQPALEEPLCEQLTQDTKINIEDEKDHRISDVESSVAGVEELAPAEEPGPIAHNVAETVSENFLIGASKNMDVGQVTEVAVMHNVANAEPELAITQATEITDDMTRVLVSDVYSETTAALSNVIPILDSNKIEIDLKNEIQMENEPSPHFVDSPTIHVKANNTESQTAEKNAETVLILGTILNAADAFENKKMIGGEENTKQKTEPTSTEMIKETGDEKIAYNFKAEDLSETIDKPTTKETEGEESESITFAMDSVTVTNEDNAIKEPGNMSEVTLSLDKVHTETDTILIEDSKKNLTADDETYVLTLITAETGEDTKKPPAISEQTRVSEEITVDGIQPPKTDSSKPISQATIYKLIAGTETTAEAPGSKEEEDLAETEMVERLCVDEKLLEHEQGLDETPKPEINAEITTKLETTEMVKSFPEAEPQLDTNEPQTDILPSKPENSQAAESRPEPYEENNQATGSMVQINETILAEPFMCEEEAGMKGNMSDQPVTTLQCLNDIDSVSSSEKVEWPCADDQPVISDTLLAEKQQDEETAQPEVHTEIVIELQEAVETARTLQKVENQLNTAEPEREFLSSKPEESQATESSHEPYKENNQAPGTAELTKIISLVLHEEGPGMGAKISEQPVEVGQCFKAEDGIPITTTEQSTEILPEDIVESPDIFAISKSGGSEHVMEVINAETCQVPAEVVSELEAERSLGFEQNIVSPDVTEQQAVSEIDISNAAVTEKKNNELTAALKLKEETTIIMCEEETAVTSEQVTESQSVTEIKVEPAVQTQVLKELKTETQVIESKADIILQSEVQTEMPVVPSLITELELETPVVTSTEKSSTKTLALTSVVNEFQSDLKTVSEAEVSSGTTLHETPIGVSAVQTTTRLSLAQTPVLSPIIKEVSEKEDAHINRPVIDESTEPKLETLVATDVISYTSAVPSLELQPTKTSVTETKTLVSTCVEKNDETLSSVVTPVKESTDVGSSVVITKASEVLLKTVTPLVQTFMELTATDITAIQKPTDGQVVQEPKMIMMAQDIKETKLETPDAVDIKELAEAKEIRAEAQRVTEQVIKEAVLTSVVPEFEETSVKEDMGQSVFTLVAEELTEASTTSVAPMVQTLTMVPTEVQGPNAVLVVETVAVNSAVVEVEMPIDGLGVEERQCDAQVAINIEVTPPVLTESELKVTEIIEQRTQDVENTAKEEANSGTLKEDSAPVVRIVESLPEADDDVWEDAVDDISDDQCSSTKASDDLPDSTMCPDDK